MTYRIPDPDDHVDHLDAPTNLATTPDDIEANIHNIHTPIEELLVMQTNFSSRSGGSNYGRQANLGGYRGGNTQNRQHHDQEIYRRDQT